MPKHPNDKLFSPNTMVRYDCGAIDYPTKWICKMCLKCLLSKKSVANHLKKCSGKCKQSNEAPPISTKINEDAPYICKYCQRVFSRCVKLKKHLEDHDKSPSRLYSELSDNEDF